MKIYIFIKLKKSHCDIELRDYHFVNALTQLTTFPFPTHTLFHPYNN